MLSCNGLRWVGTRSSWSFMVRTTIPCSRSRIRCIAAGKELVRSDDCPVPGGEGPGGSYDAASLGVEEVGDAKAAEDIEVTGQDPATGHQQWSGRSGINVAGVHCRPGDRSCWLSAGVIGVDQINAPAMSRRSTRPASCSGSRAHIVQKPSGSSTNSDSLSTPTFGRAIWCTVAPLGPSWSRDGRREPCASHSVPSAVARASRRRLSKARCHSTVPDRSNEVTS